MGGTGCAYEMHQVGARRCKSLAGLDGYLAIRLAMKEQDRGL